MTTPIDARQSTAPADDIRALADSWDLSLAAERKAPTTRRTYAEAMRGFAAYLVAHGLPTALGAIGRPQVEAWMADLVANWKPATAHNRYRALHRFFTWAVDEGLLEHSPMERMKPPKLDRAAVPVPDRRDLVRVLVGTDHDRSRDGLRDAAMLRLLYDTGMRRAECAHLKVADLDLRRRIVRIVRGKGAKDRVATFGPETARALDRYLRPGGGRSKYPGHDTTSLVWLGRKGPGDVGLVRSVVRTRANAVGVALHPHLLRHAWASRAFRAGLPMAHIQALGGWDDLTMPRRYAAHDEAERAVADAQRRMFGEDSDGDDA